MTPTSVRMWFRTGSPGRFTLLLYDCGEAVGSGAVRASLCARLSVVPVSAEEPGKYFGPRGRVALDVPDYTSDTTRVLDTSEDHRILGEPQFRRFEAWADTLDPGEMLFLFVVSAVPVLHAKASLADADLRFPLREAGLGTTGSSRSARLRAVHNDPEREPWAVFGFAQLELTVGGAAPE